MATTPFDLTGRTAVVTGANTGIRARHRHGWRWPKRAQISRRWAAAPPTKPPRRFARSGRRCELVSADLSSIEPVTEVVDTIVAKLLGRLDILVNNAGIIQAAKTRSISPRRIGMR